MNRILKKAAAVLAVMCLCILSVQNVFAEQNGPDVYSEGYCVMNMEDGSIVYSKNLDQTFYPASITKVLTALVVLENCSNLDDKVVFDQTVMDSISANSSTLNPIAVLGEEMTVRDALFGLMLNSANECASALAVYTAGSIEEFCNMMNEKAAEIGAVNSHFSNAHGLNAEDHYTTPHDMALIFKAALENDEFRYIDSSSSYTIPQTNMSEARQCVSTNQFLNGALDFEGVYAGKTGHTQEAGRTLVTAFYKDGVSLVSCIMKSDNSHYYSDTEILLEHAFAKMSGFTGEDFTPVDDTVTVVGGLQTGLRLRAYPSTYSEAVGSLSSGDAVHRTGTFGNWSKVETAAGSCYVSSQYLLGPDGAPVALSVQEPAETNAPAPILESGAAGDEPVSVQQSEKITETASETLLHSAEQKAEETRYVPTYTYQVNAKMLTIIIVTVIILIAIVMAALGIIAVRKHREDQV